MSVDFDVPTAFIPVGSKGFAVRGLNSEDLTFLMQNYFEDMKGVVERYGARFKVGGVARQQVAEMCLELMTHFPLMAVEIISRAADATDAESVEKFRRLSFVKQVAALKEITMLSVEDGPELKKVLGVVVTLLESNGIPTGPLMKRLQTITGMSGNL